MIRYTFYTKLKNLFFYLYNIYILALEKLNQKQVNNKITKRNLLETIETHLYLGKHRVRQSKKKKKKLH